MCRIWGVSVGPRGWAAEDVPPQAVARRMFRALVHGGPHAWGWMGLDRSTGEVELSKHRGRCDTEHARRALAALPLAPDWLVGHTRLATHGDPREDLHNHPFRHHELLGVHNGVLRNHDEVLRLAGGRWDARSELDSEAITAAVRAFGVADGLRRLRGTFAASWVDVGDPTQLWVTRGTGRPLWMARTEAGSLVWASEERALLACGLRLKVKVRVQLERVALRLERGRIRERIAYATPPPLPPVRRPEPARRLRPVPTTGWDWDDLDDRDLPPAPREWTEADAFEADYLARTAQRRGRLMAVKP